jgi:stalled ribosome rescue protein Dom34
MTHFHGCVWIDHREARIFGIGQDSDDTQVIEDSAAPHHIHRKADHVGLGKMPIDAAFLGEVAAALNQYKAIAIFGPGTARTELAGYLAEHHPAIAKRVWGIEPMDHPTDGQLIAAAHKYFKAADRMHG